MKNGDISNQLPPRLLVTFEGVIAQITDAGNNRFDRALLLRRWKRALDCYYPTHGVSVTIWDWVWRRDVKVDVVTFLPSQVADLMPDWLDVWSIPVSNVICLESPQHLQQRLAFMPDVARVLHGVVGAPSLYGGKGMYIGDQQTMRSIF